MRVDYAPHVVHRGGEVHQRRGLVYHIRSVGAQDMHTQDFARSIGEYGSVVFIAGNTPYKTEIAPLMIMAKLQEYDYASATSIALVMLGLAFIILFVNAIIQGRTAKI